MNKKRLDIVQGIECNTMKNKGFNSVLKNMIGNNHEFYFLNEKRFFLFNPMFFFE